MPPSAHKQSRVGTQRRAGCLPFHIEPLQRRRLLRTQRHMSKSVSSDRLQRRREILGTVRSKLREMRRSQKTNAEKRTLRGIVTYINSLNGTISKLSRRLMNCSLRLSFQARFSWFSICSKWPNLSLAKSCLT